MNPDDQNPLFQNLKPSGQKQPEAPAPSGNTSDQDDPAVSMIRQKIESLYGSEPNAKEEQAEADNTPPAQRSKHQQYMHQLSQSGMPLAAIQAAWHQYYADLSEHEKHEVWQEFYSEHSKTAQPAPQVPQPAKPQAVAPQQPAVLPPQQTPAPTPAAAASQARTVSDIKNHLLNQVQTRSQIHKKAHFQSLLFGLGMGAIVVVILLLSFFNERIIAPFITPSRSVSSTPIIIDPGATAVGPEPKIIIPKINAEIPVVYTEPSIQESAVQRALESGVLHYATTPGPGELGNGVIFGHSSNNILNKGKYKFAFVLLNRLEAGDTFMLQKEGKRYVYKVFDKKVVKPTDLSVLGSAGKPATFSLITCDPPGTSINRLVVVGEQITPDPNANVASTAPQTASTRPAELPSNSPSLWQRLTGWISG